MPQLASARARRFRQAARAVIKLYGAILGISRCSHFCSINHCRICLNRARFWRSGYGLVHKDRHSWQRWRTPTDGPEKALPLAGRITLPLVRLLRPFVTGLNRLLTPHTTNTTAGFQRTFAYKQRWGPHLMTLSSPAFTKPSLRVCFEFVSHS